MFKELKVLKLLLLVLILLLIIVNFNFEKYSGVVYYTSQPSYALGEKIQVHAAVVKKSSIQAHFTIKDSKGILLSENTATIDAQVSESRLFFTSGFTEFQLWDITDALKQSGVYFLNDSLPFFVHSLQPKDITVIYPSLGNLLLNQSEGQLGNAFDHLQDPIWRNRPVAIDEKSKNLIHFLDQEFASHKVEYVSDLDPALEQVIGNSKMIILYGYCRYVTPYYWKALSEYINKGGKIVSINSYLPEYVISEVSANQLAFNRDSAGHFVYVDGERLPFHFSQGGHSDEMSYNVVDATFSSTASSIKIAGQGNVFVGTTEGTYLAEMKTTYESNKGKTGIINFRNQLFSLGTEEWLASENFGQKEVKLMTKKVLEFVLKL